MAEAEALKPCPHCRSSQIYVDMCNCLYYGRCYSCRAQGPMKHTSAEATAAWNQRESLDTARLNAAEDLVEANRG